jgi:hypothetical protein
MVDPSRKDEMKKHILSASVIAGLTVAAGMSPSAQAVSLNAQGSGEVLIFPYYTVNTGSQTVLSVVNGTDAGKAVRLRFREARNARTLLSVNLYLSPFDVWTASLFSLSDSAPSNPGNLVTVDNSCTVPKLKNNLGLPALSNGNRYQPFSNYAYTGANDDAGPDTLDRTREGYFELIEMGEVVDRDRNTLSALRPDSNGQPFGCQQIERAWSPTSVEPPDVGYWNANAMVDIDPPRGGLFGAVSIVDALAGTMMSYLPDAIDAFSDIALHSAPNAVQPTLASARTTATTAVAQVFDDGALITSTYPIERAIDAVSALLMQNEIFNEFVTHPNVGGASEWVVTFPTKYAYTDEAIVGQTAIAPFTRIFPVASSQQDSGVAAVDIQFELFNREEGPSGSVCPPEDPGCLGGIGVPPPLGLPPTALRQLLWSSNVISFNQPQASSSVSAILGSHLTSNVQASDLGESDGWFRYRLYATTGTGDDNFIHFQRLRPDQAGGIWNGLPVTGFWAVSYTNGQLTPGVLSNYAAAYRHRGENSYVPPP